MKKLFLLLTMSLFIFSGIYGAESFIADNNSDENQVENAAIQKQIDGKRSIVQSKKIDKKELRKIRKEVRKIFKENKKEKTNMSQMLLAGAALLLLGLLLYLIVTSALIIGVIVMVLGLLLLIYGVLKQFF